MAETLATMWSVVEPSSASFATSGMSRSAIFCVILVASTRGARRRRNKNRTNRRKIVAFEHLNKACGNATVIVEVFTEITKELARVCLGRAGAG